MRSARDAPGHHPRFHPRRKGDDVGGSRVELAFHPPQPPDGQRIGQGTDVDQRLRPHVANLKDEGHVPPAGQGASRQADGQRGGGGEDHVGRGQLAPHVGGQVGELQEGAHAGHSAHPGRRLRIGITGMDRHHVDALHVNHRPIAARG
jgi:hypothetical protein